jgi:hypothetical protein
VAGGAGGLGVAVGVDEQVGLGPFARTAALCRGRSVAGEGVPGSSRAASRTELHVNHTAVVTSAVSVRDRRHQSRLTATSGMTQHQDVELGSVGAGE